MSSRKVSASKKKQVAGRQHFMCAANIPDYKCPLNGTPFDEAGYEIDHIIPLKDGGSNEVDNLQALCLMCHRVKSNRSASEPKEKKGKNTKTKEPTPEVKEDNNNSEGMMLNGRFVKFITNTKIRPPIPELKEDDDIVYYERGMFTGISKLPKYVTWKPGTNSLEYMSYMNQLSRTYKYNNEKGMYERIL